MSPLRTLADLETPTLVIDLDIMEANLQYAADFAAQNGVRLRPHTKTHKSVEIARRQVELGAAGITVAKVGEAEAMAAGGLEDIFIAHHVVGVSKLERLRVLHRSGVRLAVSVDHVEQAAMISAVFGGEGQPLDVMLEVDTGLHRNGVQPGRQVLDLARYVMDLNGVRVRGIFTHEGHVSGAADMVGIRELALKAQREMVETSSLLRNELGLTGEISLGSTPALLSEPPILPGVTELRPGTYVFNDLSTMTMLGHRDRCAATILATVTSKVGDRVILDSGSKTLSQDKRATGDCRTPDGYGYVLEKDAIIARVSEEHGVIVTEHPEQFTIGEKVRILPNHICVTVNLAEQVIGVKAGAAVRRFVIDAQGRLQ